MDWFKSSKIPGGRPTMLTFGGNKFQHTASQILPNLYLSDLMTARWGTTLDDLGVTHIICALEEPVIYPRTKQDVKILHIPISDEPSSDLRSYFSSAVEFICDALGTDATTGLEKQEKAELKEVANSLEIDPPSLSIEVVPATPISEDNKFIEPLKSNPSTNSGSSLQPKPKNVVLVHCFAGMSRSASIVCAYLLATTSMNTQESIQFVRSKRPIVQPNYGFEKQLKTWETKHFVATRKRRLSNREMADGIQKRVQSYKDAVAAGNKGSRSKSGDSVLV